MGASTLLAERSDAAMPRSPRPSLPFACLLVMAFLAPARAQDSPTSPVPRAVVAAPKQVWAALRDPFFGGVFEPGGGPERQRWNRWVSNHPEGTAWVIQNPAEARFIRAHQKLSAWAKTYPEKANLVDEHPEVMEFFARDPEARRRFPDHPAVKALAPLPPELGQVQPGGGEPEGRGDGG